MSKMDGLRAMREARYAQAAAGAAKPATRPKPAAAKAAAVPVPADATTDPTPESATDSLCGHKGMGGKPCTREQGHAAKSHRYS
jgi:hypothetical protein